MLLKTYGHLMRRAVELRRALVLTNTEVGVVGYTVGHHWWAEQIESRLDRVDTLDGFGGDTQ